MLITCDIGSDNKLDEWKCAAQRLDNLLLPGWVQEHIDFIVSTVPTCVLGGTNVA